MKEGSVIRCALQQNDGHLVKRPAIILKKLPAYNDYLVCGISKSTGLAIKGLDVIIVKTDPDFKTWGLDYPGVVRAGFLYTISSKYIEGAVGSISLETHKQIIRNLTTFLSK